MNTTVLYRGKRNYELSNHLGNFNGCWFCETRPYRNESRERSASGVNVVISDKRKSVCDEELGVEYFVAEVLSAVDYYPFGKILPDRQWYASNDTSQFVYGFNGMRYDHEINQKGRSVDYGCRILDVDLGRWLSVDPLQTKYPSTSPYAFAMNSPLFVLDVDGRDNIIYLVVLSSAYSGDKKLTETDIKNIVAEANQAFRNLGLKTEVRLVVDPDFNPAYIQTSDRIAVLGKPVDVKSYIKQNLNSSHNPHNPDIGYEIVLNNWKGGVDNPEISQNVKNHNYSGEQGGVFIAIDASALSGFGALTKASLETTGAFLILHGLGHTVGINHDWIDAEIMSEGADVVGRINGGTWENENGNWKSYEKSILFNNLKDFMNTKADLIVPNRNEGYIKRVKDRLGDNTPTDNYENSKSKANECD